MQKLIKKFFYIIFCFVPVFQTLANNVITEKPIVVSICSYNNAKWIYKNLDSVFMQEYNNFVVLYVNDASTDGTANLVEKYIKENGVEEKLILIKNEKRRRKMHNIYNALHSVDDKCIIVQLDGDDWFAHPNVFKNINKVYTNNDVWLTYGQCKDSDGKPSYAAPVPRRLKRKGQFRKRWLYTPTRTFYAWLFKMIKLEDFLTGEVAGFTGKFYPVSDDLAFMFPMIEMARYHYRFLGDVSYVRNRNNPISWWHVDKKNHAASTREIFNKKPYNALPCPKYNRLDFLHNTKADLIIFSDNDDPNGLYTLVDTIEQKNFAIGTIYILYQADNEHKNNEYFQIKQKYNQVSLVSFQDKDAIITYIEQSPHNYILCAKDSCTISDDIDIQKGIIYLEKTFAHGVYFNKKENISPSQYIEDGVYAWKFKFDKNKEYNSINMTLLRKRDFIRKISSMEFDCFEKFERSWTATVESHNKTGLYFSML